MARGLSLILLLFLVVYTVWKCGTTSSTTTTTASQIRRLRFPKYGSPEFAQMCPWATVSETTKEDPPCFFLVRPPTKSNEGIADWTSQITRAYIEARQVGCKVVFDYGLDVDIAQVLKPYESGVHNWTVPSTVVCDEMCQHSVYYRMGNWSRYPKRAPQYRHAHSYDPMVRGDYDYLEEKLPGFNLETGMACALGPLMHLSPAAVQFEAPLFTEILSALHDPNALVIALYMRTNNADVMAVHEKKNTSLPEQPKDKHVDFAVEFAKIASCLEEQYLTGQKEPGVDIQRVVWMVLSDSPDAKQSVIDRYNKQDANALVSQEKRKWKSRAIPRTVLATGSRGIHVRAERNPSLSEFAEAFIDWYLIGESDIVVTDMQSSFGPTGAMRTNRPLYRIGSCQPLKFLHEANETKKRNKAVSK